MPPRRRLDTDTDQGDPVDVGALLQQLTPANGWLVLPAFAEPHAHLDKAFLAERIENPTGDLMGAIDGDAGQPATSSPSTTSSSAPSGPPG